jgi:hypothetical protein
MDEMLQRYVRMARVAGTEVEILTTDGLPGRLASFLSGLTAESCRAADLKSYPTQGPGASHVRLAAIPISGWPEGLLQTIKETVKSVGYEIATQKELAGKFTWDGTLLEKASVGITFCPSFLADTGSILMPSGPGMGTLAGLLPEVHLAVSYVEGCRGSLGDYIREQGLPLPSRLTLVTGPSRTGDIEGTMTAGVHGPGKVLHFILQSSPGA